LQQGYERVHADPRHVGPAEFGLTVESAQVYHLRKASHRNPVALSSLQKQPRHVEATVEVVVGINVGRRPAGQAHERGELAVELQLDRTERPRDRAIECHVNAESEIRPLPRLLDGRLGVRTVHNKAGAGDDPAVVRLEDPTIDLRGQPEIVRIDHREALSRLHAGRSRSGRAVTGLSGGRISKHGAGGQKPSRDPTQARQEVSPPCQIRRRIHGGHRSSYRIARGHFSLALRQTVVRPCSPYFARIM
jgi:hypothetical protein